MLTGRAELWRGARGVAWVIAVVVLTGCGQSAFVPYAPSADLVPALAGPSSVHLGSPPVYVYAKCDVDEMRRTRDPGPNASEWRAVTQILAAPDSRARVVWFATQRFGGADEFDQQRKLVGTWFAEPCVDESDGGIWVEPVTIDGLPDGAISASWPESDDAVSTVLFDSDRRLMMIVVWYERPGAVPSEDFVDAVNTAWSTFLEDNDQ